ncbi:Lipase member H [Armadillidium vulgare]|nr:Lipase member H [Armadillidium vulgare]
MNILYLYKYIESSPGISFQRRWTLGRGQADFIDVIIHQRMDVLMLPALLGESIGDANFYPNGGVNQPGCPSLTSCSHQRVTALYVESIRPKDKTFKSWPCENYETFKNGSCPTCDPSGCQDMGYHVLTNITL